ncbi:MAG: germination protein YpeB [Firmicutes bacterium]|nr:germination protein YpeB [Bacillota bacterium]
MRKGIVPLLTLLLVLAVLWGYGQYEARRRWENRAETQYQRAFIDLANNLGGLETHLAKAAVSASPRSLRQTFAEIWRLAYVAQEKLGQLPIGAVELTRMKMLLAKVGAFAYQVTDRPAEALTLDAKDRRTLEGLRGQARYVSGQLTAMQANIVQNNLRWIDVERLAGGHLTAATVARRLGTNELTKSLVMVEDGLKRLPDPGLPESAVVFKPKPKAIAGERRISTSEGARIAVRFVGGPGARLTSRYLGRLTGEMPLLLYTIVPEGAAGRLTPAHPVRVGVTEQGGRVAWMLAERPVTLRRGIDLDGAARAAERFTAARGLHDLTVVSREELGTVSVITMAPVVDGVVRYPEIVKVEVGMDSGRVVGFEAVPYLTFHDPRAKTPVARLSPAEAKARVSPDLKIAGVRKAVILGNDHKELLCYEVDATRDGERFLVYISAEDGSEAKITRVDRNGVEID